MIKIVSEDIVDLIPVATGIFFVLKENTGNDAVKVSFYRYDMATNSIATVTKNAYLLSKFGSSYVPIAKQLGDYVSCDTAKLWNGQTFVIYSNGETELFDEQGELIKSQELSYHGFTARDVAIDNNYVWSVLPDENMIIRFSLLQNRVVMRIGDGNEATFDHPVSIEEYDGYLYVCCRDGMNIKKIDLENYSVELYKKFDEPVYKFLNVNGTEFVILESGVYML